MTNKQKQTSLTQFTLDESSILKKLSSSLIKVDSSLLKDSKDKECDDIYPSRKAIEDIVNSIISLLFPNYFFNQNVTHSSLSSFISVVTQGVIVNLTNQIQKCYCLQTNECISDCKAKAKQMAFLFLQKLPSIQKALLEDAHAAYLGDPACTSEEEVILCYPGFSAVVKYRLAHCFYELSIPYLPRIISEISHSQTGIDIHPGAQIGRSFFIDHGTGVVIGQTSIIGDNVKIYQGVTLGAKSFKLNPDGSCVKDIDRHPIIEDNVTIYAQATILGRVRIGKDSIIGANTWVVEDVAPQSKIFK